MKAVAPLMRCPRCAHQTLLAELSVTVAVRSDWTGQPFGSIQIPTDTQLRCNKMGCGWKSASHDLDKAPVVR